jgi:predicted transcriptional regulator
MATDLTIKLPDDLLAELRMKAEAQGKTVDELAEETLRKGLEDRSWQELLEYGRERGQASEFTEEQAADVVHSWREKQRGR